MVKIKMASAHEGTTADDPTKSTVILKFEDEFGVEAEYELEAIAGALLNLTLGFALKPIMAQSQARKAERMASVPDSPQGL